MKIVQFMASEKWGGAEKVFVDLSNQLSRSHDVIALLLRNTEYKEKFAEEVEIVELQSNPTTHNPFLFFELFSTLKKLKPHIIHTHAVKASYLVNNISKFLPINHVATKHNARKGRVFNRLRWVTAVSHEGEKSIQTSSNSFVKVIHNGIQPQPVTPSCELTRSPFFKILAVGRLDAIKGFDILIQNLKSISFPFRLMVAGEGPEEKSLKDLIDKLGMQECVSLLGLRNDIPQLMKESHVIAIASHSEGFPQVMVESLFYGNTLISTPVGGVRELLPPLFLTDQRRLSEKIEDVYNNYDYYCQQFQLLREEKTDQFHLEKIAEEYHLYYQQVLESQYRHN